MTYGICSVVLETTEKGMKTGMNYGKLIEQFAKKNGMDMKELIYIVKAFIEVFPMITMANLTQNKYTMLKHDNFLGFNAPASGCYDELIDEGLENIHPNYQQNFTECFGRENIMRNYSKGMTEAYAELYQKGTDGKYQWVSTHAIRVKDDDGDMVHICFCRVLDGIVEKRGGKRR